MKQMQTAFLLAQTNTKQYGGTCSEQICLHTCRLGMLIGGTSLEFGRDGPEFAKIIPIELTLPANPGEPERVYGEPRYLQISPVGDAPACHISIYLLTSIMFNV